MILWQYSTRLFLATVLYKVYHTPEMIIVCNWPLPIAYSHVARKIDGIDWLRLHPVKRFETIQIWTTKLGLQHIYPFCFEIFLQSFLMNPPPRKSLCHYYYYLFLNVIVDNRFCILWYLQFKNGTVNRSHQYSSILLVVLNLSEKSHVVHYSNESSF